MFIRNESFKQFLKDYPVTSGILAVNIIIFLMLYITGAWGLLPVFAYDVVRFMMASNSAIMQGAWWQLITAVFLHTTFAHILFNAFAILIFAPALEAMLGKWRFILAYLGAGVIANATALLPFIDSPDRYGASGAIFGLFGIYIFLVVFRREWIPRQDQTIILVMVAISLIYSFIGTGIDIMGHLTGFLSGLILGPILFAGKANR